MFESGAESDSIVFDELEVEPSRKLWLFFALQHWKNCQVLIFFID